MHSKLKITGSKMYVWPYTDKFQDFHIRHIFTWSHHSCDSVNYSLLYLEDIRAVGHLQGTSDFYVLPSANAIA